MKKFDCNIEIDSNNGDKSLEYILHFIYGAEYNGMLMDVCVNGNIKVNINGEDFSREKYYELNQNKDEKN